MNKRGLSITLVGSERGGITFAGRITDNDGDLDIAYGGPIGEIGGHTVQALFSFGPHMDQPAESYMISGYLWRALESRDLLTDFVKMLHTTKSSKDKVVVELGGLAFNGREDLIEDAIQKHMGAIKKSSLVGYPEKFQANIADMKDASANMKADQHPHNIESRMLQINTLITQLDEMNKALMPAVERAFRLIKEIAARGENGSDVVLDPRDLDEAAEIVSMVEQQEDADQSKIRVRVKIT